MGNPPNHPFLHRLFHYQPVHFGGFYPPPPIFGNIHDEFKKIAKRLPSCKLTKPWKIHHFDGIYQERWGFSWAMLVYQRVRKISNIKVRLKHSKRLATANCFASFTLSCPRPCGWSMCLRVRGPPSPLLNPGIPPLDLDLDHVSQGGPAKMPAMHPASMNSTHFFWLFPHAKSPADGSKMISTKKSPAVHNCLVPANSPAPYADLPFSSRQRTSARKPSLLTQIVECTDDSPTWVWFCSPDRIATQHCEKRRLVPLPSVAPRWKTSPVGNVSEPL